MDTNATEAVLQQIPVGRIDRNEHNPRLYFRPRELEELLESIRRYGIQVPISVYRSGSRFVLIDGERRWRCASKLNMKAVPALVQKAPSPLENMLLMFNIHALREQWDLLTIALKLKDVISLLEKEIRHPPTEKELADYTGLSRGVVRRCRFLLGLPAKYRALIEKELGKAKRQQKLTEDFFIEMERALRTVELAMPAAIDDKDRVRDVLIEKFRKGVIPNRVHFRQLGKIARAQRVGVPRTVAKRSLQNVFARNASSIEDAYNTSVGSAYQERDVLTQIRGLRAHLEALDLPSVDAAIRRELRTLAKVVRRLLDQSR